MTRTTKTIELALQGGGAHGALTWGVLDRLLDEPALRIEGISGTSAGAMNAAMVVDGIEAGGPTAARQRLETFWRAVSEAARGSPVQRAWWDYFTGRWSLAGSPGYQWLDQLSRWLSPYQLNPLNVNPLREVVAGCVDLDRVNRCRATRLFVTATNVRSGLPKVFRQPDLTVDMLMASAALPMLFQAVEIDGQAYWDGGYMGNPALFPLVDECAARDLVLVQINPFGRDEVPRTAHDIIHRLNEITFNASLIKELRAVLLLQQVIQAHGVEQERYRDMYLHGIHCDADLAQLDPSSKLNAEWAYLCHLRDLGQRRADAWLQAHWDDLGRRSTFDVQALMGESLRPVDCPPPSRRGGLRPRPRPAGSSRRPP